MMGLEPTTFCMAKGTGELTTVDAIDGRASLSGIEECP
jgi:hypothetical protein